MTIAFGLFMLVSLVGPVSAVVIGCNPSFELTCSDGSCISKWDLCNGVDDCSDGADEDKNICTASTCSSNDLQCSDGSCINKSSYCDFDMDCPDGADEDNNFCSSPVTTVTTVTTTAATAATTTSTPTAPTTQATTGQNCVSSCVGLLNGDYQSCGGCDVFASCVWGILLDNRSCPRDLVWNDKLKACHWTSSTCSTIEEAFLS